MKKIDNRGFTLIELLAALVILSIIMAVALPSISSSMERNKTKQDESRKQILESYAELYVADHKNAVYQKMGNSMSCYIGVKTLVNEGYATEAAIKNSDGDEFVGVILFNRTDSSYKYVESYDGVIACNG